MPRHWKRSRRCEDCGRSRGWEEMNEVEWQWRGAGRLLTTWLSLCRKCTQTMTSALSDDKESTILVHPY